MPVQAAQTVLGVLCLAAAWTDLRYRRLPNWLCALTLAAGLGIVLAQGGAQALPGHLLHAGLALVVGIALFAVRIIGGGDAKFYTAIAAWFALGQAMRLLLSVSLSGLALFLAWFVFRRLTRQPISRPGEADTGKFPYGIAIAAGAMITALG